MGLWKILETLAAVIGGISGLTSLFFWTYYDYTRPRAADPATGRLYALNTHGSIVYLTQAEHLSIHALWWIAGFCLIISAFIEVYAKPFRRR